MPVQRGSGNHIIKQVICAMGGIAPTSGGMVRAVLNRLQAFSDMGIRSCYATTLYNPQIASSVAVMRAQGRIGQDVKIINFYQYFAALAARDRHFSIPDFNFLIYEKITCLREDDEHGYSLKYFNEVNVPFIEERYTHEKICTKVEIWKNDTQTVKQFSCKEEAVAFWLTEISKQLQPAALIADGPITHMAVALVDPKWCIRILTLHTNHYEKPWRPGAEVVPELRFALEHFDKVDALVVLTEKQRRHIIDEFKNDSKVFVIPNMLTVNADSLCMRKDPRLAMIVTRLAPEKRIPELIRLFSQVVQRLPQARLEIWGAGKNSITKNILHAINMHGMDGIIKICGHTPYALNNFSRASVSFCASESEGFSLSILESLTVGTPVVAFDINYGPSDLIENGHNGFLVKNDQDFIDKTVLLLSNPELVKGMCARIKASTESFSHQTIAERWLELFRRLYKKKQKGTFWGKFCSVCKKYYFFFSSLDVNGTKPRRTSKTQNGLSNSQE